MGEKIASRIRYIDCFRGLAIVNMIIYHLLYDLKYIFLLDLPFFTIPSWFVYQQYIGMSFIFISGVSANYSKRLLKNGLKLLAISMVITIITAYISRDLVIYFGVLHFLSIGMLVLYFYKKFDSMKSQQFYNYTFLCSLIIFILIYRSVLLKDGLYNFLYVYLSKLPLSFVLGFPDKAFHSADYYPLIPWLFLMISGYIFAKTKYHTALENCFRRVRFFDKVKFLEYMGRHSLVIYLSHQIVLYLLIYLVCLLL